MSTVRKLIGINVFVGMSILIGFLANMAIASQFGMTRTIDVYFSAIVLPTLFMRICGDFLGKNFLPVLAEVARSHFDDASRYISAIITYAVVLAGLVTIIALIFANTIFSRILPGFSAGEVSEVVDFFIIMSPSIVLMAVNTFHEYIWQFKEKYYRIVISNLLLPVSTLFGVLVLGQFMQERGLAYAYVIGHLCAFVMLAVGTGYRFSPTLRIDQSVKRVMANSGILMASGLISRFRPVFERYFGSTLEGGAIASVALAEKLTLPLRTTALKGVRMITFSKSSKIHATHSKTAFGEIYNKSTAAIYLTLCPLVFWMGINVEDIVKALFFRGEFTGSMVSMVTMALLGFLPSVVVRASNQNLTNIYYVLDKVLIPAVLGPATIVLYVFLLVFLVDDYGIFGLAVASSISFTLAFFVHIFILNRLVESFAAGRMVLLLIKYSLIAFVAFYLTGKLVNLLNAGLMASLILSGVLGLAVYLGVLILLRDGTTIMVWKNVRSKRK